MIVNFKKSIQDTHFDALIVLINTSETIENQITRYAAQYQEIVLKAISVYQFKGNCDETVIIPFLLQKNPFHIILVGIGNIASFSNEIARRAIACGIKAVEGIKVTDSVAIIISQNSNISDLVYEVILIVFITCYDFSDYKTDTNNNKKKIGSLTIINDTLSDEAFCEISQKALIVADAVNTTRHWIDTPPIVMTPTYLAEKAEEIALLRNLSITIFNEDEINQMGMGGLAGVSRGSNQDCKLVVLEYQSTIPTKKTIGIVGKGITFDSGGLSLKPARAMEAMKDDMSGAAVVINVIDAISQMNPLVNVIAVAPLSENLPSGNALKPGDIIRFYNGKTAEIKNTDAEGRLILADALSYLVKNYSVDMVIDIATLTGACAYALGPFYTGLMSEHDELVEKIIASGKKTGDIVWRLPMGSDYKKAIKSTVADLSNTGDEVIRAGAITAAHFLQNFVGDTPWAHLDIAGTAFDVPNIPYFKSGATGVGVRLLIDLICNLQ